MVAAAALPLLAAPENVSASALLLRGRYDLRGWLLSVTMAIRLVAILVGASFGVTEALAALAVGQLVATAIAGTAGTLALRRFPIGESRSIGSDRREIVSFVVQSSIATGVISLRAALTPVLLGVVAGTTQVGYYRVALAPQSGFSAASAPVRLVLLTEQTRDWEHGRAQTVLRGVQAVLARRGRRCARRPPDLPARDAVARPRRVRRRVPSRSRRGAHRARVGRGASRDRLVEVAARHDRQAPPADRHPFARSLVLLPLVVVLGARYGVTGAAVAILVSTLVFALAWVVILARLRDELRGGRGVGAPRAAGP